MTNEHWQRIGELFAAASDLPPAERATWLAMATDGDDALAREVLRLFDADGTAGRFDALAEWADAHLGQAAGETLPTGFRIGAFAIVERIGRGGMGVVYLAERADGQFEQRVALKILRHDADRDDVRRRFLAERQILARVEHPNIARLIDGGITAQGQPWLAMEFVDGIRIDRYCDNHRLGIDRRLALFETLCDAVQHAHRSLVVHRDIKPVNVLVTADGTLKLLDFGIAKLLDPSGLGLDGGETVTALRLLTPEFAAPEQLAGQPITTATDVFQLGLMLRELLSGPRPAPPAPDAARATDRGAKTGASPTAPSRPSALALRDPAIAAARKTTPEQLARRLRGDLDTIVSFATRPEPERRYASAERLAEDVRRHRTGRPVHARPDTIAYRTSKFVRRHLGAVVAGAVAVAGLLAFSVATTMQSARVRQERDRADRVASLLSGLFQDANPARTPGADTLTVRAALDRGLANLRAGLGESPEVRARLLNDMALAYQGLGLLVQADSLFAEVVAIRRSGAGARDSLLSNALFGLGNARYLEGNPDAGIALTDEALERAPRRNRALRSELHNLRGVALQAAGRLAEAGQALDSALLLVDSATAGVMHARILFNLGYNARNLGDGVTAERRFRQSLAERSALFAGDDWTVANSAIALAGTVAGQGRPAEADTLVRNAIAMKRRIFGDRHIDVGDALRTHADIRAALGDGDGAIAAYEESISILREVEPGTRLRLAQSLANYGTFFDGAGRPDRAAPPLEEALGLYRAALGEAHPSTAITATNLARSYRLLGRAAMADTLLLRGIATLRARWSDDDARLGLILLEHARALVDLHRPAEAERAARDALRVHLAGFGPDAWQTTAAQQTLGEILALLERYAEAEPLLLDAFAALERRSGSDPYTLRMRDILANFYDRWDRPAEAAKYRSPAARP